MRSPDLRLFVEAAASSDLPGRGVFRDQEPRSWDAALSLLVAALSADGPSIVVLDEMPYLVANDPGFEGTLQKLFDRELSRRPVLLVGIVLGAIGAGKGSFSLIARAAGGLPQASLQRALQLVVAKRVIEAATPLSTRPSRETRYLVADPHLRFWLAFLGPYLAEIDRGRSDLVRARIRAAWTTWRGRAVEPVVREALRRLQPDRLPAGTTVIGDYWTRTNDPEIDLVGADREPVAQRITFVGSIKWQEERPFDGHDLGRLAVHRSRMPGTDERTPLVVVTRSGCLVEGPVVVEPDELVAAFR